MEFGKLTDISGVHFELPPDPPANAAVLARFAGTEPPRLYIGGTGWSMPEWVGSWYPAGTRSKDFLPAFGRQFNTIELNTTHYRIPTAETVARWYEQTPEDFRFCPKVPQSISHSRTLGLDSPDLPTFTEAIAGLGEKLGCCFIQLPPYFSPASLDVLERFLDAWPGTLPLAAEVRHPGWFAGAETAEAWFEALEARGAAAVITDVAGRRDVLHMRLTAPRTMVRFVGNGLHPTDYSRIDEWVDRLGGWSLPEVYFFTHEPDNLQAPELAHYLAARVQQDTNAITRGPLPPNPDKTGEQMALF